MREHQHIADKGHDAVGRTRDRAQKIAAEIDAVCLEIEELHSALHPRLRQHFNPHAATSRHPSRRLCNAHANVYGLQRDAKLRYAASNTRERTMAVAVSQVKHAHAALRRICQWRRHHRACLAELLDFINAHHAAADVARTRDNWGDHTPRWERYAACEHGCDHATNCACRSPDAVW